MIRNREDLSVIETVKHDFGELWCGLCYPEKLVVVLGIENNLVEFDFDKMKITKKIETKNNVFHIEKFNNDTFLTGDLYGHIELVSKRDLSCLSHLKLDFV